MNDKIKALPVTVVVSLVLIWFFGWLCGYVTEYGTWQNVCAGLSAAACAIGNIVFWVCYYEPMA